MKVFMMLLVILAGCSPPSPRFQVGQCVEILDQERWETDPVYKIYEIGVHSYRVRFFPEIRGKDYSKKFSDIDGFYHLIPCPDEPTKP